MLGKLIKYEWKNTAKICGSLNLFLVLMTVIACLSFCTPMWEAVFTGNGFSPMLLLGIMFLILYFVSIIGVLYGILIYLGVHFYRTMYSEEGYLTHTLPVTGHQLLVSKILTAVLWYLIVMVLLMASIFALLFTFMQMIFAAEGINFVKELFRNWDTFLYGLEYAMGGELATGILFYILQIVVGVFGSVMILFGAITIGQLSSKHKVMMSIISYFGITTVLQIISSMVMVPVTYYSTQAVMERGEVMWTTTSTLVIAMVINLITAIVLYFSSHYIINKKLNLD